jgi:hypothetical protein
MESSNINEVVAWIEDFVRSFDFTRPGKDKSLGRDIVGTIIRGRTIGDPRCLVARSAAERRGADTQWKANESKYAARKAKDYGVFDQPNYRTGQMLSQASLWGKTEFMSDEIIMRYGTGDPPSRSAAPTQYLSTEDQNITDIEKAYFATNVHDRPFYEIDDEIEEAVLEEMADALSEYIQTEGA